jgi:meso-butanediol dehydrogenase/(S,S)-butanediol dehydrogenase/diacetyl reductase
VADLPFAHDQLDAVVGDLGGSDVALGVIVDVTDAASVEAAVAAHVERFGGLDVMVANAGIAVTAPFMEITAEQWQQTMDVNLKGVLHCYQSAARQMIAQVEAVVSSAPHRSQHIAAGGGKARTRHRSSVFAG